MQVVAQLSIHEPPDDVRVLSLRARQALSEPFEVAVRFVSTDTEGSESIFHGIVEAGLCSRGSFSGRGTR
jgi:hypothetical protein